MSTNARNALIVLALALAVYALPGGGDGAAFIGALLSTAITVAMVLIIARLYREHRTDVFSLGDQHRVMLYGAIGAAVFAMAARQELWDSGGLGLLIWFAIIGAASYMVMLVWRQYRSYA